ncbi:MAG: flagellar M-ring protein FliF [Lachnospiraceae bacterium]|nr:flagellar M-ring protein FliF [Lachnospiraceae bacterium]
MPAQVRALLERILEWWNKFTTRQKTLIITGAVVAVLTVAILIMVLTRPVYTHLYTATSGTEASQVNDILTEAGLDFEVSRDGMTFSINRNQEAQANVALNGNNIRSASWSITDVTTGGFSTTESDKNRLWVDYLEKKMAGDFVASFDAIKSASVQLNIPDNDGTLLAKSKESGARITLELADNEEFTEDNAAYLARAVATALGNPSTDNVVIMDNKANLLFAGGEENGGVGTSASQFSYKSKAEQEVRNKVRSIVLGTGIYSLADVAVNLNIDFSNSRNTTHEYYAPEGQSQGVLAHEDYYTADNTAGIAGVPGTDANDETTYVLQDNQNSSSSVEEYSRDYLPHESITESTSWGRIDYTGSTISVTATRYDVHEQDKYVAADHDNMRWDEYKNSISMEPVRLPDDNEAYAQVRGLIANASGIPVENVELALFTEPFFVDSPSTGIGGLSIVDIVQIALIIVILALLSFVILRSMRTTREEEEEGPQELSVESLLESQPLDADLENIEMDAGSETKRLIEKFIDENPEAAAALLRNWLNEGYM